MNIEELLIKKINEYKNKKSLWKPDSKFISIRFLQIDSRGKVGEILLYEIFKSIGLEVEHFGDATGDFDIKIKNYRVEVKTGTLDVNNKFQHEGIKPNEEWDIICFVDIAPNKVFITFIPRNSFAFGLVNNKKETEYGRLIYKNINQNIHFRGKDNSDKKATGAGYKVDLKLKDLKSVKNIDRIVRDFKFAVKTLENSKLDD